MVLLPYEQTIPPIGLPFQPVVTESSRQLAANQFPPSHNYLHHQPHSYEQSLPFSTSTHPEEHIQTIFISGLPDDVVPREIHNLLRRRQCFEACQLKYTGRGNQVVAFASFYSHSAAMSALHELDGRLFDPETGATLHVELAKSNSRAKRGHGNDFVVIDKRAKVETNKHRLENKGDGGSDEPYSTNNTNSSKKATTESAETGNDCDNMQGWAKNQRVKATTFDIPPCSTLFIANLGPTCSEGELTQTLSQYPGFRILKLRERGGMPVAFADFEKVEQATKAMVGLQGILLASSDRGGLHLEYARSKMRKQ